MTTAQDNRINTYMSRFLVAALGALCAAALAFALAPVTAEAGVVKSHELTVAVDQGGTVTNAAGDFTCAPAAGGSCVRSYAEDCAYDPGEGGVVCEPKADTFTYAAKPGFRFSGWTGCDRVVAYRDCDVLVDEDRTVHARFTDIQQPSLDIGRLPGVARGIVPVTATASDNVGVTHVEFWTKQIAEPGTERNWRDNSAPYSAEVDTTHLEEGEHAFGVRAFDAAGNFWSISQRVTVDNVGPTISFTTLPPAAMIPSGGSFEFGYTTAGNGAEIAATRCEIRSGAQTLTSASVPCGPSAYLVSGLADGVWELVVEVEDEYGNIGRAAAGFRVGPRPVDPVDPTDPLDPTDPTDPIDPVDPADPTGPGTGSGGNGPGTGPGGGGGTVDPAAPAHRSLALRYARRTGKLSGRVSSTDAACTGAQKVRVMRTLRGKTTPAGSARTAANGTFALKAKRPGRYSASVAATADCAAAASKRVAVGR